MSSVRMCDRPDHQGPAWSRIFSEASEGWSTGTIEVMERNERTGKLEPNEIEQDNCGPCMDRTRGIKDRNRPELTAGDSDTGALLGELLSRVKALEEGGVPLFPAQPET